MVLQLILSDNTTRLFEGFHMPTMLCVMEFVDFVVIFDDYL
ncbi:hypothetical protein [Campylobacter hyointestinalis]|nr:hypothetical protein [Campylobacter hyointestinalis]